MASNNSAPALECIALTKSYGGVSLALSNFNLFAQRGKIIGILGPVGCGKSSLLKIAAGLEAKTSGELFVLGESPSRATASAVAYMPERINIDGFGTVGELVSYYSDFFSDFRATAAVAMLSELHLFKKTKIKWLSTSAKRKLQLILTMARSAELYLLDEPTAWITDGSAEFVVRTVLANCPPSSTVIVASSQIADVEQMLDDFFFITYGGRILLSGSAKVAREGSGRTLAELAREVF